MSQRAVVTIADMTQVDFESRRPGCAKGVMQVEDRVQSAVFRVAPHSGVPAHLHSSVNNVFIGIRGCVEIRYEGQLGHGVFELKAGGFCAMPPGVKHEVYNPSGTEEAFFVNVHAPYEGYDFVPVDFRELERALPDREYVPSQPAPSPGAAR